MIFLLANWRWLLPSAAAAGLGIALMFARAEIAAWEVSAARQQAEAATVLAETEKRAREAENRAAEAARNTDENHAKALAEINATRDGFAAELDRRVRDAERRGRSRCPVPGAAPAAIQPADAAPSSDDGYRVVDTGRIRAVRNAALTLQAYAKACHAWAAEVGR